MRGFRRIFFWGVFFLFILLPVVFVLLVLEHVPVAADVAVMNTDNAVKTRAFAKQVLQKLLNKNDRPMLLSATEDELNGAFSIAHRSMPRIRGWVVISDTGLEMAASLRLPANPIGNYVNLQLTLNPSEDGFNFTQAAIGRISLSEGVTRFLIQGGLDLVFGGGEGEYLLGRVQSVRLKEKRIDVSLKPIPRMKQLVEQMKTRAKLIRDEVALVGDPALVRIYYRHIMDISKDAPQKEPLSLAYYISRLFKIAAEKEGDAAAENRSAILALGIYFGSWRVEQMIGPVRTEEMLRHKAPNKQVGLSGRRDLRLHFIISAALEIASKSGVTHAIGEFKELLDASAGGSGFSFADLAADRAGVRFAEVATHPETAALMQRHFSKNNAEDQFFPEIAQLPEGLSQAVFEHYFVNIEDARYLALVHEIDVCLSQLPAYALEERPFAVRGCDIRSVVPAVLLRQQGLN